MNPILRNLALTAFLLHGLSVQGQISPSTPTSQASFASQYNTYCSGAGNGTTACQQFLYNITNEHHRFTDYISRENSAIEDAVEEAENDWTFIVNQLKLLNPQVEQFKTANVTTKQSLINQLQSNVSNLVNQVNPILDWEHKTFTNILAADANDSFAFTQQLDAAVTRVLARAMNVTDLLSPQQTSQYVLNSSGYLDQFFNSQFGVENASLVGQQKTMLGQLAALLNLTSYYQNFIQSAGGNAMRAASNQLANLNRSLPQAISVSQAALNASLSSLVSNVGGTGNTGAEIASKLAKFQAFAAAQLASFSTQFNSSLDGVANTIYTNLNSTLAAANAGASAAINLYNQSQSSFLTQWQAITAALSNMSSSPGSSQNATQYLIKDSELGADSLENFNYVAGNVSSLLSLREQLDQDRLTNATNTINQYASNLATDLTKNMDQLTLVGGPRTVPAFEFWETFAANTSNATLPGMSKYFQEGVNDTRNVVFGQIGNSLNASTADVSGIRGVLGAQFAMVNQSELVNVSQTIFRKLSDEMSSVQGSVAGLRTQMNAKGKAAEVSADAASSLDIMANLSRTFGALVSNENQTDLDLLANVNARQVQAPANLELANYAVNQARISNITNRQSVVHNRLVNDAPVQLAAHETVSSLASGINEAIRARTERLSDEISAFSQSSRKMIDNYASSFVNDLPVSTGFQAAANAHADGLDQLEKWISKTGSEVQGQIQAQINTEAGYRAGIDSGRRILDAVKKAVAQAENIEAPNFQQGSISGQIDAAGRVNAEAVLGKLRLDLGAQVSSETKSFNAKSQDVNNKLSSEQTLSSQRVNALASEESHLNGTIATSSAFLASEQQKVDSLSKSVTEVLNSTKTTLDALNQSNKASMMSLSELLSNETSDLLYQVRESAPAYLAQMEASNVTRNLLPALITLNNTVTAINSEAASLPLSFLHESSVGEPKRTAPAEKVRAIVKQLSDREQVNRIKTQIQSRINHIQAVIALHVPVLEAGKNMSEAVDLEASQYPAAADLVLQRVGSFTKRMFKNLNQTALGLEREHDLSRDETESKLKAEVSILKSVIANLNLVESNDIRKDVIPSIKRNLGFFKDSIEALSRSANFTFSSPPSLPSSPEAEVLGAVGEAPRLSAAKEWVFELLNSLTNKLAERNKVQFGKLDETLNQILGMQKSLQKLARTEEKIESDFDSKILQKLQVGTKLANQTTEESFQDLGRDLDKETRQDNAKMILKELESSIRQQHIRRQGLRRGM